MVDEKRKGLEQTFASGEEIHKHHFQKISSSDLFLFLPFATGAWMTINDTATKTITVDEPLKMQLTHIEDNNR